MSSGFVAGRPEIPRRHCPPRSHSTSRRRDASWKITIRNFDSDQLFPANPGHRGGILKPTEIQAMRDILATRIDTEMPQETTTWQSPRSLLEAANITEQSRAVLDGELRICLETAFELFIDARSLGYRPGALRLDAARGEHWRRISGANTQSAKRVWTRALGNPIFSDIDREDVALALAKIRNLPKYHGKRCSNGANHESGLGKETSAPDRIGISTFLKFGRTARQVGDLLVELNLKDANPFDLPPGRPSFITRVLGVDSRRFRVGQARRARSPQIAQAPGALLRASGFPARNAA